MASILCISSRIIAFLFIYVSERAPSRGRQVIRRRRRLRTKSSGSSHELGFYAAAVPWRARVNHWP